MTYPTKEAMETLNRLLRLPATGREQDWDIELADADRVNEFADYLEHQVLNDQERQALMALTLGSLEDLTQREVLPSDIVERIKRLLQADVDLYMDLIRRWSHRQNEQDGFAISDIMNSFLTT